ncbi:hypothetical protein [Aquitalea magnusonii]|uniref:Uncharacterized protein n=1 Tax=Aquitalea magnusonii TaxID=332411 RepID=A0A318JPR8_9NEIS|nr:hypothetical protein [Aquitalea magnusonii]PXX51139.1 hypothetical protein DFR38_101200 [Aquitalea magnusonii]
MMLKERVVKDAIKSQQLLIIEVGNMAMTILPKKLDLNEGRATLEFVEFYEDMRIPRKIAIDSVEYLTESTPCSTAQYFDAA